MSLPLTDVGSGGTVRRSAIASVMTRRLSSTVRGQGVGLARRLCCVTRYQGGQLVDRRTVGGYPEVGSSGGRRLNVAKS
ncbi:hypothetical protein BHM03_00050249 [Ensete ventricosum]|nr:hypothetical protein BHM03_00050249 [Ensete ventricosum]